MFSLVLGKPGSGKSLYLAWLSAMLMERGCLVASNLEYTDAFPYSDRFVQLGSDEYPVFELCNPGTPGSVQDMSGGRPIWYRAWWHFLPAGQPWKIFIQEIDNYFDSNEYQNIPSGVRHYFKQHRKFGHDIWADCQNLEHLWTRIRRMAQRYVICEYTARSERLAKWLPKSFHRFIHSEFGSADFSPQTHMGDGVIPQSEAQRVFKWYNSDQIINVTSFPKLVGGR